MKKPKKIKIVQSNPRDKGQAGIFHLIGNVYDVILWDEDYSEASVIEPDFGGEIVLHESEFEVLQ